MRILRVIVVSTLGVCSALQFSNANANEQTLTGCLTGGGTLIKLAIGDIPKMPCKGGQQLVTLQIAGEDSGPQHERVVFVTSDTFTGDLGGIAGADVECQRQADDAGLEGVYRAWLSDSQSSPATDPDFFKNPGPYIRVDGAVVANSWDDLTDGTILSPIEVAADGSRPGAPSDLCNREQRVWTGTTFRGTTAPPSNEYGNICMDWTSSENLDNAGFGCLNRTDGQWTDSGGRGDTCAGRLHLFCFQQ